jgi:hypothetical protein
MRNELQTATDKDKKEYLDSIWDEIMECQRAGGYYIMDMNTTGLSAKKTKEFKALLLINSKIRKYHIRQVCLLKI